MSARVLVACIGNVMRGDDGFGPEVARTLAQRELPAGVSVRDFGIRGHDLVFELMAGWDAAVLVDASARGGPPGSLYVIEPALADGAAEVALDGAHDLHPERALALVDRLGARPQQLRVLGCEPEQLGADDEVVFGLSAQVARAVEPAATLVLELVRKLAQEHAHA